jgi:hypothetical protein
MDQSCGCAWRHGGSPSPVDVGHKARPLALKPEDTVATGAGRSPFSLLILQQFGIDACCGGQLTLAQAAASVGVPVETLLRALEPAVATTT